MRHTIPCPPLILLALSTILGAMSLWLYKNVPNISIGYLYIACAILFLLIGAHFIPFAYSQKKLLCYQASLLLSFFIFGFLFCLHTAAKIIAERIPNAYEGAPLLITGKIISLPEVQQHSAHFDFLIGTMQPLQPIKANIIWSMPKKIHLSWYFFLHEPRPILMIGDTWRLTVRLKSARSTFNPASFDYEAWLFAHRITAIGSVVNHADNQKIAISLLKDLLQSWRQKILIAIEQALPNNANLGVVEALALGVRDQLSSTQWQIMEATGTNHLLAIAGLHIGFVFGFFYLLSQWLWRRITRLMLYVPAHAAGLCIAWVITLYYSMLSGFALPAERALAMLSIAVCANLLRRYLPPWQSMAIGLLVLFLCDPLIIFSDSFYLSFIAVMVIIYALNGYAHRSHLLQLVRLQWLLGFALAPFTLYFFHQMSLINGLANAIAIPWIAWGALPFIMLGIFFLPFSHAMATLFWQVSAKILTGYWPTLHFFARLQGLQWQAVPSLLLLVLALLGVMLLFLPKGFPGRFLGLFALLPLLFTPLPVHPGNTFKITQLDVGQGLSTLIQTAHHTLVFDTGPRLDDHYDMGQSVVVPALIAAQCRVLDMLMISHGDNDHSGGAQAVLNHLPVKRLLTSVPELYTPLFVGGMRNTAQSPIKKIMAWLVGAWSPPKIENCQAGQSWQWDGVVFTVLSPSSDLMGSKNNRSCVLHIHNAFHSILLTGDIEKPAEQILLKNFTGTLHAEIIVAPHHGSKTSSSTAFLLAVRPTWVFYATGYRNRFHFPSDDTVARYQSLGVISMNTAKAGQISAWVPDQACCIQFSQARSAARHFWNF